MLLCDVDASRQFAGADIVLRTGSGKIIQYFQLRSGFDKHAGGELSRVNTSPDGLDAEMYGTVKMKEFLIKVDPEELLCKEIEDAINSVGLSLDPKALLAEIHASIQGDPDRGTVRELVRIGGFIIYSTGRYILRDEGGMSTAEMSKNFFELNLG